MGVVGMKRSAKIDWAKGEEKLNLKGEKFGQGEKRTGGHCPYVRT